MTARTASASRPRVTGGTALGTGTRGRCPGSPPRPGRMPRRYFFSGSASSTGLGRGADHARRRSGRTRATRTPSSTLPATSSFAGPNRARDRMRAAPRGPGARRSGASEPPGARARNAFPNRYVELGVPLPGSRCRRHKARRRCPGARLLAVRPSCRQSARPVPMSRKSAGIRSSVGTTNPIHDPASARNAWTATDPCIWPSFLAVHEAA